MLPMRLQRHGCYWAYTTVIAWFYYNYTGHTASLTSEDWKEVNQNKPEALGDHPLHLLSTAPLQFCYRKKKRFHSEIFKFGVKSQIHNHTQQLKVRISNRPLNNQTWQTEWKTAPLAKMHVWVQKPHFGTFFHEFLPQIPHMESSISSTRGENCLIMRRPLNLRKNKMQQFFVLILFNVLTNKYLYWLGEWSPSNLTFQILLLLYCFYTHTELQLQP